MEGIDEKLPGAAGNREGWEMKKNDIDEMDKKRDPEKILQEIKEQEEYNYQNRKPKRLI